MHTSYIQLASLKTYSFSPSRNTDPADLSKACASLLLILRVGRPSIDEITSPSRIPLRDALRPGFTWNSTHSVLLLLFVLSNMITFIIILQISHYTFLIIWNLHKPSRYRLNSMSNLILLSLRNIIFYRNRYQYITGCLAQFHLSYLLFLSFNKVHPWHLKWVVKKYCGSSHPKPFKPGILTQLTIGPLHLFLV